jgi:hypothetical protein
MDWLTVDLVNQITELFPPTQVDIYTTTEGRDQTSFAENCLMLFPEGRIFASDKKIEQALEGSFLDA